MRKEESKEG